MFAHRSRLKDHIINQTCIVELCFGLDDLICVGPHVVDGLFLRECPNDQDLQLCGLARGYHLRDIHFTRWPCDLPCAFAIHKDHRIRTHTGKVQCDMSACPLLRNINTTLIPCCKGISPFTEVYPAIAKTSRNDAGHPASPTSRTP